MSKEVCKHCGSIWDSEYEAHYNECERYIASRQMKALESIAASLEKMAHPPIDMDHLK